MTNLRRLVLSAVFVLLSIPGRAQTLDETDALAKRIGNDLARRPFGLSSDQWRQAVPSSEWRQHRGEVRRDDDPTAHSPGLWCMAARDTGAGWERHAVFYAFRPARPLACRLEQLQYVITGDLARREQTYAALVREFTGRLGTGNMSENRQQPPGFHSEPWTAATVWGAATSRVWVYRNGKGTGVFVRHQVLESAYEKEETYDFLGPRFQSYGHATLTWEVSNALWPSLPEAADVLLDQSGIADQEAVVRTSLQVLKGARQQTTMFMRGAYAIAAHQLLGKLYIEGQAPPLARPPYAQLGKLGASCEYDGHGDSWNCAAPALVAAFMRQHPHARWSHLFYLEAIGSECEGAGYDEVIKEGIPWLRRHPNSEFAPFMTAAIAAAYETWWSLSLAPADEEFVTASDYGPGAAGARAQAIRWYERLQQKYPESAEAKKATLNANQVKIGVDTGQRRFYCVIP